MYEKQRKMETRRGLRVAAITSVLGTYTLLLRTQRHVACPALPRPAPRPKINAPPILYGLCTFFFPSFLTSTCMSPTAKAKTSNYFL